MNGVLVATRTDPPITITNSTADLAIGAQIRSSTFNAFFFQGRIDEASIYNRALTQVEITSIVNAGLAGKLKTEPTTLSTKVGDATIFLPTINTNGLVQEIPLDPAVLPALPVGSTATGLFYDVATSADFTGNPTVCFNLPSFTVAQFPALRILHLENGVWVNRTAASNTYPTLCSDGLTSLSPFAIVQGAVCNPILTITDDVPNFFPGGLATFTATSIVAGRIDIIYTPPGGSGFQSITEVLVPPTMNAIVDIDPLVGGIGTLLPQSVNFTVPNPNLPVDFTILASSRFHGIRIRVQCACTPTFTVTDDLSMVPRGPAAFTVTNGP